MALLRDAIFKKPLNILAAIKVERNNLNLKGVQKVTVRFDPFGESSEIRKFTNLLHSKTATKSNPKCILKTEILTDRSEQTITFNLIDGKEIIFKCANLKALELYKLMNKYITPLAPEEIEVSTKAPLKMIKKK